jgi:lipopolysaccharide/colanic/teichoic acid biosynthesis glycosyltransferase
MDKNFHCLDEPDRPAMYETKGVQRRCKRLIDIIVSLVSLLSLLPVFLVITLLIKLTSKGPVFYRWKVVGKGGKPFTSYKFRTMCEDADHGKKELMSSNEMNGPVFKIKDDPRITSIGRILRKFSIDEFPQLFSVLKGDMSLVGPRPPLQYEYERFEAWQKRKLSTVVGTTCLREVRHIEHGKKVVDFDEWMKLDLEYIDNWSLWLDLKILAKTVVYIIKGKNC